MRSYRENAIKAVDAVYWEALELCCNWTKDEEYGFDLSHIIQLIQIILEEEERNRMCNEG